MITRFAPSPTGELHVGNLRTAIWNALLAYQQPSGTFILRIEDTDLARSQHVYIEKLMEDLTWLGLEWQQGPTRADWETSAYRQTQRLALYEPFYAQCIERGLAYWCTCTEEELQRTRAIQLARGEPPRYPGTCRHRVMPLAEAPAGAVLRFHIPAGHVMFHDSVRGEQRSVNSVFGDFVIRKANHTPSFLFCNAIDDVLMQVSHVLRGEDHLTNTFRQIILLKALELPAPVYGHFALIHQAEAGPLSKRQGDGSLGQLRAIGYLPAAVVNYLARLGSGIVSGTLGSVPELAQEFKMSQLSRSPAVFDEQHLRYWQKLAIQQLSPTAFLEWLPKDAPAIALDVQAMTLACLKEMVLTQEEARECLRSWFAPRLEYSVQTLDFFKTIPAERWDFLLSLQSEDWDPHHWLKAAGNGFSGSKKMFYQCLRLALTDTLQGPDMTTLLSVMGEKRVYERLEQAKYVASV